MTAADRLSGRRSAAALLVALEHHGFELRGVESLREHYALTLRRWLANLQADPEAARRAAGTERERIWRLYIAGAAGAFSRGELSVFETLAVRGGAATDATLARATDRSPR